LVCANSKVVILGRPTAFLTDAEYNYALHGLKTAGSYEVKDPDWPDYREINIAPFTKYQIATFLPKYIEYLIDITELEVQKERLRAFINFDIQALLNGTIGDIARRPVQLKMITEILPDFHGKLSDLTVHGLYDYFIDYVIERESFKLVRRRYKTTQRRAFTRDIAFWLWNSRERSVLEEAIPSDLVEPYRATGEDNESVTRELVSASLLDRRLGGRLFFPHRSFQEFLVAEAIKQRVVQKSLLVGDIPSALTPQVAEFLDGFVDKHFLSAVSQQLDSYRGALSFSFLKLLSHPSFYEEFFSGDSPWALLISAIAIRGQADSEHQLTLRVAEVLKTTRDTKLAMSALFATLVASGKWSNSMLKEPSSMIISALKGLCRNVEAQRPVGKKKTKVKVDFLGNMLVNVIRSLNFSGGKNEAVINITGVYKYVRQELQGFCYISDWDSGTNLQFSDAGLPERIVDRYDAQAEFRNFISMIDQQKATVRVKNVRQANQPPFLRERR
jgi:hypothetical protein